MHATYYFFSEQKRRCDKHVGSRSFLKLTARAEVDKTIYSLLLSTLSSKCAYLGRLN